MDQKKHPLDDPIVAGKEDPCWEFPLLEVRLQGNGERVFPLLAAEKRYRVLSLDSTSLLGK